MVTVQSTLAPLLHDQCTWLVVHDTECEVGLCLRNLPPPPTFFLNIFGRHTTCSNHIFGVDVVHLESGQKQTLIALP